MADMPTNKTFKLIAVKPMTTSSIGLGNKRACGMSVDALRHTFNMNFFSS